MKKLQFIQLFFYLFMISKMLLSILTNQCTGKFLQG